MLAIAVAGGAQESGGAGLDEGRAFASGELRVADLGALQRVVVVEGGRPMPLDSYARFTLLRLSGRSSHDRRPAIEWLARVLFTPNETHDDDIFVVDNPEVIDAMGLPSRGRDRYSLSFLLPGLPELERLAEDVTAIGEDSRTIVEREILRLWNNVGLYANLLSSFAFTYPHRDFQVDDAAVAELLGLPGTGIYSYLDIALRRAELREAAMAAGVAHATSGAFSRTDELLLRLSQSLSAWQGNFVGLPLAVIPVGGFGDVRWLSPWQALAGQQTAALGVEQRRALESELLALRDLQVAYLEGRDLRFALATRQFTDSVRRRTADELEVKNPALEILFNRTNPYLAARIAYGGGLLLLALSFLGFKKWLYRASLLLLVLGLIPHTFGLVLRILITDRPPVTNLFETFVFVGWGAAVCGIAMEYLRKHYLGLFSGLAGGFVFFLLSGKFAAADTMPVLQAVLDTNFWLSTHVTVITAGYMACCVAGLLGHVYMVQAILQQGGGQPDAGRRPAACAYLPDHVRDARPGIHLRVRRHHARRHLGGPVVGPVLGLGSEGERRAADRAVVRDPDPRPDGQDDRSVRPGGWQRAADHRGDDGVVRHQPAGSRTAFVRLHRWRAPRSVGVQRDSGGRGGSARRLVSPPEAAPIAAAGSAVARRRRGSRRHGQRDGARRGRARRGKFHRGGGGSRRTVIRRAAPAGPQRGRPAARPAVPVAVP